MSPRATFDAEARALTVELDDGTVAGTIAYPDSDHLADVDVDGRVLLIEILQPSDLRLDEMAVRFGFLDRLGEIKAAVRAVAGVQTTTSWFQMNVVEGSVATTTGVEPVPSSASSSSGAARELDLVN
jgi:hypothetical protein